MQGAHPSAAHVKHSVLAPHRHRSPPAPPRPAPQKDQVCRFTSQTREWFESPAGVCITTYTMASWQPPILFALAPLPAGLACGRVPRGACRAACQTPHPP